MKTREINTRFMTGHQDVDGEIMDLLLNEYGTQVYDLGISFDECIYSTRFIAAVESGLIPDINRIEPAHAAKKYGEYHHFIYNDECFTMYFK